MKIVLRSDVDKVGKRGDIVEVADGYARNFLLPRKQAIAATAGIEAQAKAMRAARDKADAKNREEAQLLATRVGASSVKLEARAGAEGRLFGSITNADIVKSIKDQLDIELDKRHVDQHDPIRTTGEHTVTLRLHADVHAPLKLEVVSPAE